MSMAAFAIARLFPVAGAPSLNGEGCFFMAWIEPAVMSCKEDASRESFSMAWDGLSLCVSKISIMASRPDMVSLNQSAMDLPTDRPETSAKRWNLDKTSGVTGTETRMVLGGVCIAA